MYIVLQNVCATTPWEAPPKTKMSWEGPPMVQTEQKMANHVAGNFLFYCLFVHVAVGGRCGGPFRTDWAAKGLAWNKIRQNECLNLGQLVNEENLCKVRAPRYIFLCWSPGRLTFKQSRNSQACQAEQFLKMTPKNHKRPNKTSQAGLLMRFLLCLNVPLSPQNLIS